MLNLQTLDFDVEEGVGWIRLTGPTNATRSTASCART